MKNGPYTLVKAPEDYPGKKYRGRYVYEHHLVWWQRTGQAVPAGYNVHHKNGIKTDNRFDNLELLSHAEHALEHGAQKGRSYSTISCVYCGVDFQIETRNYKTKTRLGQKNFFCCRSHQVKHQWIYR